MSYLGLDPQQKLLNASTQTFSGNSVAIQFPLDRAVSTASDLDVIIGNVPQRPFIDYVAGNTVLLFTSPPATGTDNITVTFRGGALNSLDLSVSVFEAGTVGAPSVVSVAANNSGIYWASANTLAITVAGGNKARFNNDGNTTSTTTGAVVVTGGIGVSGNVYTGGKVRVTDTTESDGISSGSLTTAGGVGISGNLNVGGDITCVGDFTVNGTFTTTGADSLEVADPFIFLANANPGDSIDSGIITEYYDGANTRYTGVFRDITDGQWKLFGNLLPKPTTTVDTGNASYQLVDLTLATLSATGNVEATYFIGDGGLLSNLTTGTTGITNGGSEANIPAINGNINLTVNSNLIANVYSAGFSVVGTIESSDTIDAVGNITGGNLTTAGLANVATLEVNNGTVGLGSGNISWSGNVSAYNGNLVMTSPNGTISSVGNISANFLFGNTVSAVGNVRAGNVNSVGIVSSAGNIIGNTLIRGANIVSLGSITATSNVVSGNVNASGLMSATANVLANNVVAANSVVGTNLVASALVSSANVSATNTISSAGGVLATGNISSAGNVIAAANVVAGNLVTSGSFGNITGANIISCATLSANASVEAGNVNTTGEVSATGNITGGNLNTTGSFGAASLATTGNLSVSQNANIDGVLSVAGSATVDLTLTAGNVETSGIVSATGNVVGGNVTAAGTLGGGAGSITGNVNAGNIIVSGITSSTGNITGAANVSAGNFVTTGALFGNLQGTTISISGNITSGNVNTAGMSMSGNIVGNINGTGILTMSNVNATTAVNSTGNVVATGNVSAGNLVSSVAVLSSGIMSAVGNITAGNIIGGAGIFTSSLSVTTGSGTISGGLTLNSDAGTTAITNGASNAVGNIGSSTTYFNTVFAKSTSALYADLAEMYDSDAEYEPGTVVSFGGEKEITVSQIYADSRVAGVISTNPSFVMNMLNDRDTSLPVALVGRVPTSVTGSVQKGDTMISNGDGTAVACNQPVIGTVIGKAVESFDGEQGVIEIVVGRL